MPWRFCGWRVSVGNDVGREPRTGMPIAYHLRLRAHERQPRLDRRAVAEVKARYGGRCTAARHTDEHGQPATQMVVATRIDMRTRARR